MKIHYATALASVALVAIHVLFRVSRGFTESLEYESVIANYEFLPYAILAAIFSMVCA